MSTSTIVNWKLSLPTDSWENFTKRSWTGVIRTLSQTAARLPLRLFVFRCHYSLIPWVKSISQGRNHSFQCHILLEIQRKNRTNWKFFILICVPIQSNGIQLDFRENRRTRATKCPSSISVIASSWNSWTNFWTRLGCRGLRQGICEIGSNHNVSFPSSESFPTTIEGSGVIEAMVGQMEAIQFGVSFLDTWVECCDVLKGKWGFRILDWCQETKSSIEERGLNLGWIWHHSLVELEMRIKE